MQPPCNPEYPSQAAIQAGAISALFSAVLGNNSASAVTIIDSIDPKLARQFATVAALAEEQRMVRIWGGIHFRSSLDASDGMGRAMVAHLVNTVFRPVR